MILERLLGTTSRSAFMENHFLRLPFASAGGCGPLARLGGWEAVGEIISRPEADLVIGCGGSRYEGPRPAGGADVRGLMGAGCTLGIRHAEKHHAGIAELADWFRQDFLAPIDVHLYCTPAGSPGFGWHYDAEDVFILQTLGSKEWWLRKNTVNPWPLVEALPADMRYEREIMPVMRCNLQAGDWLYIPNGYWHRTQAGEESISLSVGVLTAPALAVFDFLRPRLAASLRWRQRLPPAGEASLLSTEELLARYRELFTELGQDLAATLAEEELAREFLRSLGCSL